jgi:hypothetical protein
MSQQLYGSYAAKVVEVHDPTGQGRVRLVVPQVHGTTVTGWARPASVGTAAVGDQVVVAFDGGDVNYPVFWPVTPIPPTPFPAFQPPIQPATWVPITSFGPNVKPLSGWQVPGYHVDVEGIVHLRGMITSSTSFALNQLLFTLPFNITLGDAWPHRAWDGGDCAVYVLPGNPAPFSLSRLSGTPSWIALSSISFFPG